jgi:predicted Zn-dependent peptidase
MQSSGDLGASVQVEAIAQPGVPLDKLEAAIDAELKKIASEPMSAEELMRAKNQYETGFVSRLQSVVARASMLNQYETFVGDPGWAERDLERYRAATADGILRIAKATLDPNARVVIHVVPQEKKSAPQGAGGAK